METKNGNVTVKVTEGGKVSVYVNQKRLFECATRRMAKNEVKRRIKEVGEEFRNGKVSYQTAQIELLTLARIESSL